MTCTEIFHLVFRGRLKNEQNKRTLALTIFRQNSEGQRIC